MHVSSVRVLVLVSTAAAIQLLWLDGRLLRVRVRLSGLGHDAQVDELGPGVVLQPDVVLCVLVQREGLLVLVESAALASGECAHARRRAVEDAGVGLVLGRQHDGQRVAQHELVAEVRVQIDARQEA